MFWFVIGAILLSLLFTTYVVLCNRKTSSHKASQSTDPSNFIPESEVKMSEDYDIVIVGAGIIGASMAGVLAKDNHKRVLVIERDMSEPDRIIGELLQPGGVYKLNQLGLGECLEGMDAPKMKGYAVFSKGEIVHLPYPECEEKFGSNMPTGRSFHHGKFIMKLREFSKKQANVTFVEGTVNNLLETADGVVRGVEFRNKATQQLERVFVPLTIVANGAGSVFTKRLNCKKPFTASTFVGVYLEDSHHDLPFKNHGHVILSEQAPILLYPITPTTVRVLIDFPGELPSIQSGEMQKFLENEICPVLPESMRSHFLRTIADKSKIRSVPNREMPAEPVMKKGIFLMGDAFNCRHPLTGGGMTVCFGDVLLLTRLLREVKDLNNLEELELVSQRFFSERKSYSSTINILANALYSIFAPRKDPMIPVMRDAVFEYFKVGGICAKGPMGLLSGLIESPYVLIAHFFSVAILYNVKHLLPIPSPKEIIKSGRLMKSATNIIAPLISEEGLLKLIFPSFFFSRSEEFQ